VDRLEERLADVLGAETPEIKVVYSKSTALDTLLSSLKGAWGLVLAERPRAAAWSWMLPRGGRIWEVQSEMEPAADLLHLAGAADLQHRLTIVPKGAPTEKELDALVERLVQDIRTQLTGGGAPAAAAEAPVKPRIVLPAVRAGFFVHKGDSFREMVRLWAERGFVDIVESPLATQVWLGGIGETLLYDRPTLEWLERAPKAERSWKQALFGNPEPPAAAGGPVSPWTFWPRRPKILEFLAGTARPATPFEDRKRCIVFYGRSENAVQRERRSGADWASVCDEFQHDDGEGPYPLSPTEYLTRLAEARYGLCLAGYGRKCHREIECMAMGCVPIVAAEVDMDNYAEPPEVGVHYFRVKGPEEAKHVVENMTAERWATMSAACRDWWRRNASAEGSWRLTERLAAQAQAQAEA
jgi:hypothetical protein